MYLKLTQTTGPRQGRGVVLQPCPPVADLARLRQATAGRPVLLETLLDFRVRGARALEVALVHHHDVGEIEHDDLLQLQPAAVIRDSSPARSNRQFHFSETASPLVRCLLSR